MAQRDWSASAFIGIGNGFVVVRKRLKDGSWSRWHLPNGKKDPEDETESVTVLREIREETGLITVEYQVTLIYQEPRKVHRRVGKRLRWKRYTQFLFLVTNQEAALPLVPQDHDHQARIMSFAEYLRTDDFNDSDRRMIKKNRLV